MSLMCSECIVSHGAFPKQTWKGRVMFANGILKIACEIFINYFFLSRVFKKKALAAKWRMGCKW